MDVALLVVFPDVAAHDAYQETPAHKQFIAEFKANWNKSACSTRRCRPFELPLQPVSRPSHMPRRVPPLAASRAEATSRDYTACGKQWHTNEL